MCWLVEREQQGCDRVRPRVYQDKRGGGVGDGEGSGKRVTGRVELVDDWGKGGSGGEKGDGGKGDDDGGGETETGGDGGGGGDV